MLVLCMPVAAWAHDAPLDPYGCHSNKTRFGNATMRECHADLLAGQVFASATAEYKAYIAAEQVVIADLKTTLTACEARCPRTASVTIGWAANTEPDVKGYRVYCGTASHIYSRILSFGLVRTAMVTDVPTGITYYCAVTAFDGANNESDFSKEVSKAIP